MSLKIALIGNPNSGKTTLFNALTGANQYVGNWPGVTVEKKEGKIRTNKDVTITDLPGIYSLSPYTPEEIVARDYLIKEKPDVVIDVVDATNLERNLYLTTQLLELGVPVVIALNMMDILEKSGEVINIEKLEEEIGCKVVKISALKNKGTQDVASAAIALGIEKKDCAPKKNIYNEEIESVICEIEACLESAYEGKRRWYAVKLFEKDSRVSGELSLTKEQNDKIASLIESVEKKHDDDSESIIINAKYEYITAISARIVKRREGVKMTISDKIDKIVTHRIWALPIFVLVMLGVYAISIGTIGNWVTTFMNDVLFGKWIVPGVASGLDSIGCAPWLTSLVADGIVGGVGAVLGFVPQMLILFLLLSLLEDCGYMSRVAFIMDRVFRKLGLSGKSFIPMIVALGCGVPGIMASRTIDQESDRKITIMTTGFIPCGAKMPVVGLIAGAFFGGSAWIATSAYFIGVGAVIISGIILKKTKPFRGEPAPFVMELPPYHPPVVASILKTTWDRGWGFIKRAGSVILIASVVIWTLNSLSFEGGFHYITEGRGGASVLELIGSCIAFIFKPLGFGAWQTAVATILGLVAKEEIVGTFGTLSSMASADLAMEGDAAAYAVIAKEFFGNNALAGFSFMMFNLLCAPCFAAMGAIKREMNSWKWTWASIGYMTAFAYATSLIVYQLGMLFTGNGNAFGSIVAFILLAAFGYFIFRKDGFSLIDLFKKKKDELK